jgi:nucleotide-binding universal stress UspA family protein
VDTSATGNLAIPVAYRLCEPNGTVHLLHVAEPPYLGNPLYGPYVQGYVPTPAETKAGEEKVLDAMRALVPPGALAQGVRTEHHLAHGVVVAREIVDRAVEWGVDAIVMGTHGRTGFRRVLMGSVATDVMKDHRVPVVLVHQHLAGDA